MVKKPNIPSALSTLEQGADDKQPDQQNRANDANQSVLVNH